MSEQGAMSLILRDRDALANTTAIAETLSKSSVFGVKNPADAFVLMLTCVQENITPFEFTQKYHIIQGRPSMRADAMLASFKQAGGKVRWINLGDDGKKAEAGFTFGEQEEVVVCYTIDDAKRAGLVKPDSGWAKNPDSMLRARLASKAIRIVAPELVAGIYTPEEIEIASSQVSEAEITAKQAELDKLASAAEDNVIDVVPQEKKLAAATADPPAAKTAEKPSPVPAKDTDDIPFDVDPETSPCTAEQLQEIVALAARLGKTDLEEVSRIVCEKASVDSPENMTLGQASRIIDQWKAVAAQAKV